MTDHPPRPNPPAGGSGAVRILFDGGCPFCSAKIDWLRNRADGFRLELEDIRRPDFDPRRYRLTRREVEQGLHAILPDGRVVSRMDAVRAAYAAVGLGRRVAPTRWPILRPIFDAAYFLFSRRRMRWGAALLRFRKKNRDRSGESVGRPRNVA